MDLKKLRSPLLFIVFIEVLRMVGGCSLEPSSPSLGSEAVPSRPNLSAYSDWLRNNPCGSITIKRPLFNVTGYFPEPIRSNATAYLFTAPNTSLNAALFVIDHCAPLMKVSVKSDGWFKLPSLPQGYYVVAAPRHLFPKDSALPIMNEYRLSSYSITAALAHQSQRHTLAVLSVLPADDGGTNTENWESSGARSSSGLSKGY